MWMQTRKKRSWNESAVFLINLPRKQGNTDNRRACTNYIIIGGQTDGGHKWAFKTHFAENRKPRKPGRCRSQKSLSLRHGSLQFRHRKLGTTVKYAIRDPLVGDLLKTARHIFENHLKDTQTMLRELRKEGRE